MRLVIVSGLSGAGKSVALNLLEDMDFYCIDNVPAMLMETMISGILEAGDGSYDKLAMGVDARAWIHAMKTPSASLYVFTPKQLASYQLATHVVK